MARKIKKTRQAKTETPSTTQKRKDTRRVKTASRKTARPTRATSEISVPGAILFAFQLGHDVALSQILK